MSQPKVTFFSTRGRNLTKNLELLRDGFRKIDPALFIDYYVANFVPSANVLKTKNALGEQISYKDMAAERNLYSRSCGALLSCDISIAGSKFPAEQPRVLLMEPHDYLFKTLYEYHYLDKHKKSTALKPFTDIICYGKYWQEHLSTYYDLGQSILHAPMAPFADSLNNRSMCASFTNQAEQLFPGIKTKKVLSIITASPTQKGTYTSFISIDLKGILSALPSEWVIYTNNLFIAKKSAELPSSLRDRVLYCTKKLFDSVNALYFTDMLVSDLSNFMCSFAATRRPFYVIDFSDNYFTKYIMQSYKGLMLRDFTNLHDLVTAKTLSDSQIDFCNNFAPSSDGNSIKDIYEMIFRTN